MVQSNSVKFFGGAFLTLAIACAATSAQDKPQTTDAPKRDGEVRIERNIIVQTPDGASLPVPPPPPNLPFGAMEVFGHGGTFDFVSTELNLSGKVVKGAPYSATGVTERTQTLPDGNRIVNKSSSQLYRDSEGRTRREQTVSFINSFMAANPNEASRTIFINDPVAGVNYILNEKDHTARKLKNFSFDMNALRNSMLAGKSGLAAIQLKNGLNNGEKIVIINETKDGVATTKEYRGKEADEALARIKKERGDKAPALASSLPNRSPNTRTESLGKQIIEGVEAEGTRTTTTIPAGKIGNERDIDIVSERWYSNELQALVMTKQDDPRTGTNVYRLTNISRGEPSRTLFEVPADYTVKANEPLVRRTMRMKKEE
ncbi:MAG: hypothetical protein ABR577_11480 [Pyrinomonadaceae bacterium]